MRILLPVSLLLLSLGCGKAPSQDPAFADIVDSFVQEAASHGKIIEVNSKISFGDVGSASGNDSAVGVCHSGPNGKSIILDQAHWNAITPAEQKSVLYHELGHCELGRGHDSATETVQAADSIAAVELPASIMNPSAPSAQQLVQGGDAYYQSLLTELFR